MKNTSKSARRSPPRDLTVHRDILLQHFNSLTCENQMKYELTEPEEGKFTFGDADLIVDFAKKMGVKLRAHAPVWHMQTGEWMFRDGEKPAAPELIYERIDAHTKALAEHFNDAVYCWDVVNEAARDDLIGTKDALGESEVYRNSMYFQRCGARRSSKRRSGRWKNILRTPSSSITTITSACPKSATGSSRSSARYRRRAAESMGLGCSSTIS